MKAKSFFGVGKKKETGVKARQVGTSSATPGVNTIVNTHKQTRNSHVPKLSTKHVKHISRPVGKVENSPRVQRKKAGC